MRLNPSRVTKYPTMQERTGSSGPPGGSYRNGNSIIDTITSCTSILTCTPIPEHPRFLPSGIKVHHRRQTFYVGTQTPGMGVRIQTDTLQRWLDHAAHEGIVTPVPSGQVT